MVTAGQMRKLALGMPEVEERSHFEQPDFRVRGKIFAGLSRDEKTGTLKLTSEIQSTLIGPASAFTPATGGWGRSGWTQVDLGRVDAGVLEALLTEAWRIVAPKTLVARASGPPAKKKPAAAKKKSAPAAKKKKAAATRRRA